jgi:hypothetical protein
MHVDFYVEIWIRSRKNDGVSADFEIWSLLACFVFARRCCSVGSTFLISSYNQ